MADDTDARERGADSGNTGGSRADRQGMGLDPGKEIITGRKSAGEAKQDMEFGEAMEADMDRLSRGSQRGRTVDESWKYCPRYDGNKNLEAGQDLNFTDKMYTPAVKDPQSKAPGKGDGDIELGEDNPYFWNSSDEINAVQKRRGENKDNDSK